MRECKMVQLLWKAVCLFLKKINRESLYDAATPFLGLYPEELKQGFRDLRSHTFIAALFPAAKRWKQLTCPSMDEWVNTMGSIHTMGCYSTLKRKGGTSLVVQW